MRSVPHRVVCLVGLDDGVFPRAAVGRRRRRARPRARSPASATPRSEDRQLLLDAVMAATEHAGRHLHRRQRALRRRAGRPPCRSASCSTPLDRTTAGPVRDAGAGPPPAPALRRRATSTATTRAPRRAAEPFSFDRAALAGARAAAGERGRRAPFLPGPLPPRGRPRTSSLADLHGVPRRTRCARSCASGSTSRTPLERRRGRATRSRSTLDSLERGRSATGCCASCSPAQDPDAVMLAEQLRGTLPPGELGVGGPDRASSQECAAARGPHAPTSATATPRAVDVDVDLGDGRRLTGTVAGVYGNRARVARLLPPQGQAAAARLGRPARARAPADPDEHWTAHAVGRDAGRPDSARSPARSTHRAVDWLRDAGRRCATSGCASRCRCRSTTSLAWAEDARARAARRRRPTRAARPAREWETDRVQPVSASPARTPTPTTSGSTATARSLSRSLLDAGLATYAWQVWEPLLAGAEQVGPL